MQIITERLEPRITARLEPFREAATDAAWNAPTSLDEYNTAIADANEWLARAGAPAEHMAQASEHSRDVAYERRSISLYLGRVAQAAPDYYAFIKKLAKRQGAMSPDCRLAVMMPATQEGEHISQGLQHMLVRHGDQAPELAQRTASGTTLDPELYEVTVGINHGEEGDDTGTKETVKIFSEDSQLPLTLHAFDVILPAGYDNVGMARRLLHDLIFVRSLARPVQKHVLYLATEDADTVGYDPLAFSSYINHLDRHPQELAVRLDLHRDIHALKQVPYLLLKQRLIALTLSLLRSPAFEYPANAQPHRYNLGRIIGFGTAISATAMANAGGFPITEYGEDMHLGEHLAVQYGSKTEDGFLPAYDLVGQENTVVMGSARRILAGYITNLDPYEGFEDAGSNMTNLTRRPISELIEQAKGRDVGSARNMMQALLQSSFSTLLANAPSHAYAAQGMKNILTQLGFTENSYRLGPSRLTILEWSSAEIAAKNYMPTERMVESVQP